MVSENVRENGNSGGRKKEQRWKEAIRKGQRRKERRWVLEDIRSSFIFINKTSRWVRERYWWRGRTKPLERGGTKSGVDGRRERRRRYATVCDYFWITTKCKVANSGEEERDGSPSFSPFDSLSTRPSSSNFFDSSLGSLLKTANSSSVYLTGRGEPPSRDSSLRFTHTLSSFSLPKRFNFCPEKISPTLFAARFTDYFRLSRAVLPSSDF